ncbi:MAG TPA: hypothetical protein H9662_08250 [Firmicutes bacterium]|nr:hypothetical protein [Bacillota bacterium]
MGKKLLSVIVLCTFMLLVLTGCNSTQGENTQTENLPSTAVQPFESSAQFTYGDFAFEAVVRRDAPGTCIITLTSPKAVEGMKFTYQSDKLTIEYLGMHVDVDPNAALSQAAVSAVVKALDAVTRQNGIHVSFEDGKFLVSGETENGDFTLILDEKSGNFLSLEMPEIPMSVTFHNFKLLSAS